MIQQLKKLAVLYLACLVASTLALTAVYCLPVRPIQEHVRVSVDAFLEEGDNRRLWKQGGQNWIMSIHNWL